MSNINETSYKHNVNKLAISLLLNILNKCIISKNDTPMRDLNKSLYNLFNFANFHFQAI